MKKYFYAFAITIAVCGAFLVAGVAHASTTTGYILPTSDGYYTQWTPSSGTTHYTLVDESSCNGTTDYVYADTNGYEDSYGISISSIPNGSTITAIEITPCASNDKKNGTNSTLKVFYRYNGSDSALGGNYTLSGQTPTDLSATAFNNLTLSKDSNSTLEVGADVTAGTKGARLSRIATRITYFTTPAAPSNLSATNISSTENDLAWTDNSNNEDGFKIYRNMDGGVYSMVATTTANSTSYHDINVTANHWWYYKVTAYNSDAESGYSNVASANTYTVPTAPSNLGATNISSTENDLAWTDNSNNEDGFKIYRSMDGGAYSMVATTTANSVSFNDTSVTANHWWYYKVTAYNAGRESSYSNVASANTYTLPAAPSNLWTYVMASSTVQVAWTDNSNNETSFKVERSSDGINFSEIGSTGANINWYNDNPGSGTWYYRARAYNPAGYSDYSNTANAIVP